MRETEREASFYGALNSDEVAVERKGGDPNYPGNRPPTKTRTRKRRRRKGERGGEWKKRAKWKRENRTFLRRL